MVMSRLVLWRQPAQNRNMHEEVLTFWFGEIQPAQWWAKDEAFDQSIRTRFAGVHARAARCELFAWRTQPRGRLAEVIVLDQFSRNLFRGSPLASALHANSSQRVARA
jgi:uncharacterized protein (DUF924 family)